MESEIILRPGFEYRYRFWMDNELLSTYEDEINCSCACYWRSFILEVRTNFILKPSSAGEQILDSERFASILKLDLKDEKTVHLLTEYRLFEYWLPEKEIQRIAREAFRFVKRIGADTRNASLHVIPIVVGIDVCTVQFEGESICATIDRAIKPDFLIPFQVWGISIVQADGTRVKGLTQSKETNAMCMFHRLHLLDLPRERVEDVGKGLDRMEACPVCSKAPTFGAQLTPLPCDHVFHNHCIVRWLMDDKTCPVCRFEIKLWKQSS